MSKGTTSKSKIRADIAICTIIFIALQALILIASAAGIEIISNFNGVIMACQFGVCLIMVCVSHRRGIITSLILMGLSVLFVLQAIFVRRMYTPIPGLCNTIVYIITLILLGRQFKIREREAITDVLTGLLNRRGLYRLLQEKIEDGKPFNVAYVDLGNFKFINDNFGHAYGDLLMKSVADRMSKVVGRNGTITRIGGDEFVILLEEKLDPAKTVQKILERIGEKSVITVNDNTIECYLTASAGIANFPDDSKDFESLIKYADIAMYQASRDKVNSICFFDKQMERLLNRQMELENLIKEGLENDYFYLVYQPQFETNGKKLRGFETLIRMKTPNGSIVSPGEFIPVAEKGDLILKIDDYVIYRAIREFKEVVETTNPELIISINVSAKNIADAGFVDKISTALKKTGFPAKNLEIEITEYCLVQSVDITINNISKLREMGINIALDDFGTGYSSLSYLSKMPISLLKIDKSLVDDIEYSEKSLEFVRAVISMGHIMGCEVISEGVEGEDQLALLKRHDCDLIQGFVWGKPMEYNEALKLCASSK